MESGTQEQGNGYKVPDLSHIESFVDDGKEKDDEGSGMVDWLGRPASGNQLGGWRRRNACIFGAATCGYFAFGGIYFNLVLYLLRVFGESNSGAANDLTNLLGTMFFTSLIGAFLGDAYWGRLWTVVVFLVIYVVGCVLVSVAATIQEHSYPINPPSRLRTFLFISLYITAIGNGSYEPVLASLGGDQYETPEDKGTFFNWFFVFCNIGQLLSLTVLTYFENEGKWALGFWIATGAIAITIPLFLFGAPKCRQHRAGGNPFLRIAQVLVAAVRKFNLKVSPGSQSLYEVPGGSSAIPGSRKIRYSAKLTWLDKAAAIGAGDVVDEKRAPDAWRLCTVTQVEEVKCLVYILPIFITGVLFNTIVAQLTTLFIEQGATMDPHLGRHFKMPAGTMQIFTVLAAVTFAPIYDRCLVPWFRKRTGHPKGLPSLQRMGWGLLVSIVAMVAAAVVEMRRLHTARVHNLLDAAPMTTVPLSIFWLAPQYAIVGIALVLVIVGQMDFFYTETSDGMRSIGISLPLVCRGLGNYASTLLVTVVTSITEKGGKVGWIPRSLNRGHVDYFYWVLAIMMAATLIFYVISAHFYSYLEIDEPSHRTHTDPRLR